MSFITTESGICISPLSESVYPECGDIIREGEEKYIRTEGSRNIKLDGDCGAVAIPAFSCNVDRKTIDEGKFVTLTNTCTLPFTVTGFRNSDPSRFSLFSGPSYLSVYSSGNTTELPFTLKPFRSINIPTFFHPSRSELENGNAGTYEKMTGDSFSAKIDMYPGVPVTNCSEDELSCDSHFTLSGQLLCPVIDVPAFLSSDANFTTPNTGTISSGTSSSCLESTAIMGYDLSFVGAYPLNTITNHYKAISGASEYFPSFLGEEWYNAYNVGVTGALGTFYRIVTGIMESGLDSDINNLLSAQVEDFQASEFISGSYRNGNHQNLTVGAYTYTGMNFKVNSTEYPAVRNQTVFFNANIMAGDGDDARMFIVSSGDFSQQVICEVNA